jgi:hypothetical protein
MRIVERSVSGGDREVFDREEFLARPLYAHLAHASEHGPRESPVWFHWDGQAFWIIGGSSFPGNLRRESRCALGIVDWNLATGLSQHVGMRGRAEVLPLDPAMARTIFRRYFGPDEADWDRRFDDVLTGDPALEMIRIVPKRWSSGTSPTSRRDGRGNTDDKAAGLLCRLSWATDRLQGVFDMARRPKARRKAV